MLIQPTQKAARLISGVRGNSRTHKKGETIMKKKAFPLSSLWLVCCLILFTLDSGRAQKNEQEIVQPERIQLPPPKPGHGHAHGIMFFKNAPRKGIPIYLHKIKPDKIASEPVARTDEKGRWVALNLKPGKYVTTAFKPSFSFTYTIAYVHEVKEGGVADFGQENTVNAEGVE